jgi:hypothetical protein
MDLEHPVLSFLATFLLSTLMIRLFCIGRARFKITQTHLKRSAAAHTLLLYSLSFYYWREENS